ncbi:unnamed protein product [Caenorhabditis auriculariae]|uniref:Uncharacterized protein n=1 Tax=Caenorhabditis auriculariae TaxID=2777116 RepID=A0A8S1GT17_9PELO|nr:unnamed protein product [Caenorhabditis auriculariae]
MLKIWSNSLTRNTSNEISIRQKPAYVSTRANSVDVIGKRRNLDYFEPQEVNIAASSTRSPTPSDIEYITVDVDRTLALAAGRKTTT